MDAQADLGIHFGLICHIEVHMSHGCYAYANTKDAKPACTFAQLDQRIYYLLFIIRRYCYSVDNAMS